MDFWLCLSLKPRKKQRLQTFRFFWKKAAAHFWILIYVERSSHPKWILCFCPRKRPLRWTLPPQAFQACWVWRKIVRSTVWCTGPSISCALAKPLTAYLLCKEWQPWWWLYWTVCFWWLRVLTIVTIGEKAVRPSFDGFCTLFGRYSFGGLQWLVCGVCKPKCASLALHARRLFIAVVVLGNALSVTSMTRWMESWPVKTQCWWRFKELLETFVKCPVKSWPTLTAGQAKFCQRWIAEIKGWACGVCGWRKNAWMGERRWRNIWRPLALWLDHLEYDKWDVRLRREKCWPLNVYAVACCG